MRRARTQPGGGVVASSEPELARSATASISLDALRANLAEARRLAGARQVLAVVKADAYGHGAVAVARTLASGGAAALATWSVAEARGLRDAGVDGRLLVLGGVGTAEEAEEALATGLEPVLHDRGGLEHLVAAAGRRGAPLRVQVEVDTGMRRMGVDPGEASDFIAGVAERPELELAGVFTHFARGDEADLEPTREQLRIFARVLAALTERGVDPGEVHAANSAGVVAMDDLQGVGPAQHAVRPGLMLYGAQPSATRSAALRPVMSVSAPVVALRRARAGEAVGYSATYRAPADTCIATLALGYADGVPISASGRGVAWLAGELRPFAGRVSMDYVALDVGDAPVRLGDRAVLFGAEKPGGPAVVSVDDAAAAADTLSYELLVRVGARVTRVVVGAD